MQVRLIYISNIGLNISFIKFALYHLISDQRTVKNIRRTRPKWLSGYIHAEKFLHFFVIFVYQLGSIINGKYQPRKHWTAMVDLISKYNSTRQKCSICTQHNLKRKKKDRISLIRVTLHNIYKLALTYFTIGEHPLDYIHQPLFWVTQPSAVRLVPVSTVSHLTNVSPFQTKSMMLCECEKVSYSVYSTPRKGLLYKWSHPRYWNDNCYINIGQLWFG